MNGVIPRSKKSPTRVGLSTDEKRLIGRKEAAELLSKSQRALDYLVANKQLQVRRIGTGVLIPRSEVHRFVRGDHPERLARLNRHSALAFIS